MNNLSSTVFYALVLCLISSVPAVNADMPGGPEILVFGLLFLAIIVLVIGVFVFLAWKLLQKIRNKDSESTKKVGVTRKRNAPKP